MSMQSLQPESRHTAMAEINTTPLVDVMLVLLIIFMITAPLLTHAVKINLPEASSQPNLKQPETVTLAIDAQGQLYWNNEPIAEAVLATRLEQAARGQPQPELHLRVDRHTLYERIARIMAAVQSAGMTRIGFVTEPQKPTH